MKRRAERTAHMKSIQTAQPSPSRPYDCPRLRDSLTALNEYATEFKPRVWSHEVTILIVQYTIIIMMVFHLPLTTACGLVSYLSRAPTFLQPKVARWLDKSELDWKPPEPRGAAAEKYKRADRVNVEWTDQLKEQLIAWMNDMAREGRMVTARLVQSYLKEQLKAFISARRIRRQLRIWKFGYARGIEVAVVNERAHEQLIAKYIVHYARARQLEQQGSHVIVYTDESYCFNNHAETHSWFPPGSNHHVHRSRRAGRYVIFHAMTRHGLLTHKTSPDDSDLRVSTVNAEYIYPVDTKKKGDKNTVPAFSTTVDGCLDKSATKEDYHGYINNDMWLTWLNHRLLPAFEASFPGKKMILCMDNAQYHKPRPPGYICVSRMRKADLLQAMQQYHLTPEKTTCKVMKLALRAHLMQNSDKTPSITHELMYKHGHKLLWTPPFEPGPQPIERIWGQVKGCVARMYSVGRKMDETLTHLHHALYTHQYGDVSKTGLAFGVTCAHCRGSIERSETWINRYITEHSHLLQGTIDDLRYLSTLLPRNSTSDGSMSAQAQQEQEWREDEEAEQFSALTNGEVDEEEEAEERAAIARSFLKLKDRRRAPPFRRIELTGFGDDELADEVVEAAEAAEAEAASNDDTERLVLRLKRRNVDGSLLVVEGEPGVRRRLQLR